MWGNAAPANAVMSIRNHVTRIRRVAPGLVVTDATGYRFAHGAQVRFDAHRADEVFADLADVPEVLGRRHAIRDRLAAEVDATLASAVAGAVGPGTLAALRVAVDAEPYRETRWALLAFAQASAGQRRDALLTLQSARDHLAEVGLTPGDQLVRVEQAVLDGDVLAARAVLATSPGTTQRGAASLAVHPHHDEPFSGRADELATLGAAWETAVGSGQPQLVVIDGPAGSGKTRLVDRFITGLAAGPAPPRVMWGRHRATADRAHGAIGESLARLFDEEPELADVSATRQLRQLVALDTASDDDVAADADVAFARTRLGRELTRLVAGLGDRPTVWLLDDIQWAEADSLGLIEEAFDAATAAILLIVTARQGSAVTSEVVATLGRTMPVAVVRLAPLGRDDLDELVRVATNSAPSTEDVEVLHRRTGGLALYVSEILRLARRTGSVDITAVPAAIRDWIQHRLRQLDPSVADTLRLAALLDDIDLDVLVRAAGRDRSVVSAHCDDLHATGLLAIDTRTGTLDFSHEMTREAVIDSIGPVQRMELERLVAEALLAAVPGDHDRLAIHFDRARDPRAFEHALLAAERALGLGAWDHARTMSAIAMVHADGDEARARSLVGTGRALLASGDAAAARPVLDDAIRLARRADAPVPHARAALALVGRAGRGAINDDEHLQLTVLRAVLDHLTAADDGDAELAALRCDLERELAIALLLSDAADERSSLLRGALDRAHRLDPPQPRTLAAATLGVRYALLGPADLDERLAHTADVIAMPAHAVDLETRIAAWVYRHEDLRRAGRHAEADDALVRADDLLAAFPHPYWSWAVRTWEALGCVVRGDLERAEAVAVDALALRPGVTEAAGCLGVTLVDIRLYQQRAGEVVDMLRATADAHPHIATYRAVLALCAAEAGSHDVAREALRWFTDSGCTNLPPDTNRFLGLAVLAHAAAELGDHEAAAVLLPLLEPYAGQWVILSAYGGGGASWGPADHALARLGVLTGDLARSHRWFDEAAAMALDTPLVLERITTDRARTTGLPVGRPS